MYNFYFCDYKFFCFFLKYRNRNFIGVPEQDSIVRKYVKINFSYLGDIEKRSILAFVNTDPAVDFNQPLPPNVIPVAGLHVKEPTNPLPKVYKTK